MEKLTINKAYKTELKPNKAQIEKLTLFGHVARKVYNWALSERLQALEAKTKISKMSQQVAYTSAKSELHMAYCPDFPRVAMEYTLEGVENAFKNYFRKKKEGKSHDDAGFPKFKSKYKAKLAFRVRSSLKQIENDRIYIVNIGWIKLKEKGYIPFTNINKVNFASISQESGRWFVAVTVEEEICVIPAKNEPIGIDRGIKTLAVCSDGSTYSNDKVLKKNEKKIRKLNKELSRRDLRSKNWYKTKDKLNKTHATISRIRDKSLHEISKDVTYNKQHSIIAIEDLNVSGMVKNRKLAKAVSDASMSALATKITYKSEWYGNKVVKVDRFFPSSKTCSFCGSVKNILKLSERTFTCEACGGIIDRDLNAAINIKNEALRTLTI